MPAKIESPFQTGLDAKVYWTVYVSPGIGHTIAQTLAGNSKTSTGPIYKSLKKLQSGGFLTIDSQDKYFVNIEKLTSFLSKKMQDERHYLDSDEFEILKIILDSFLTKMFIAIFKSPHGLNERIKNTSFSTTLENVGEFKFPHNKTSFIVNLTASIAITSMAILHVLNRKTEFKNKLQFQCRQINQFRNESSKKPISITKLFGNFTKDLEKKIFDDKERLEFLKNIKPENTWTKDNSYSFSLYLLWNLMFLNIPYKTLEKFTALHKDASTAYDYVTQSGRIFGLSESEQKEWLKSIQRRHPN